LSERRSPTQRDLACKGSSDISSTLVNIDELEKGFAIDIGYTVFRGLSLGRATGARMPAFAIAPVTHVTGESELFFFPRDPTDSELALRISSADEGRLVIA
jgi:hypothetical protein